MKRNESIAYEYESKVDDIILDYFNEKGYTITRREGLNRIDYDITHNGKDILLEVKTRYANSTDYDTAWIRQDKVEAMNKFSNDENKPAWLMYVFLNDRKFFLADVDELNGYGTTTRTVYNPITLQDTETNVEIPLSEKKMYDM